MITSAFFHHVALNVEDYDKTVCFYQGIGFKKHLEWEENGFLVCFLDTGNGLILELHGNNGHYENSRLAHISIHADNVDAFYRLALKNGGESIKEPFDADPLVLVTGEEIYSRMCWVRSPNGETIEIIKWKGFDPENYRGFLGFKKESKGSKNEKLMSPYVE
jgi:catechol 2,3-dioxygenase-like lactoylglutathione lyase family enzyme